MPALIHIYIVIVGSILLAIVLMTVRMMARSNQATEELSLTDPGRESVAKFDLVTRSP